ncbi:unnamed protein product [Closterium sp. Yama58-4]|nr:unnamed protein product [Closterium sp. Yama58-4]
MERGSRSRASSPRCRSPQAESPRRVSSRPTSPQRSSPPARNRGGGGGQSRSRRSGRGRWAPRARQPDPAAEAATAAATAAVERALAPLGSMIRELGRPTAPVVPTVDQLPPPLDLHPHPPPPVGPPANVLPTSSLEVAAFPRSLPHPPAFPPQPPPLAQPEPPMVVRLPPHAVPGVWRVPPTGGAPVFQPLGEPGIDARTEPPVMGPPLGIAPPPQAPPAGSHGLPARGEAAAAATAAGGGVSTEPRSRRSPMRRHSGGLRVGSRVVLDRLSRRGGGAPRALEVETQLLVRLWHMRTYYAVVGAMLENAAVSLSHVPLAACMMGHAQLLASRDGAWLLRHEMEFAGEEPEGEPREAGAAVEMEGVGSRVQSRSAVDVIDGLVSALRLGDEHVAASDSDDDEEHMRDAADVSSNAAFSSKGSEHDEEAASSTCSLTPLACPTCCPLPPTMAVRAPTGMTVLYFVTTPVQLWAMTP